MHTQQVGIYVSTLKAFRERERERERERDEGRKERVEKKILLNEERNG